MSIKHHFYLGLDRGVSFGSIAWSWRLFEDFEWTNLTHDWFVCKDGSQLARRREHLRKDSPEANFRVAGIMVMSLVEMRCFCLFFVLFLTSVCQRTRERAYSPSRSFLSFLECADKKNETFREWKNRGIRKSLAFWKTIGVSFCRAIPWWSEKTMTT